MATNLRLLDNNLLFGTGVTVTGSALHSSVPPDHVLDANRNKAWWSGGTSGTLVFDLGAAQNVTALGLVSSNLGTTGTVIIQANSSDSWGAPAYNSGILNPTAPPTGAQVFFFANKFYRYWRLILEGISTGTLTSSAQSGTFSTDSTWTGGVSPRNHDAVAVLNTHTVDLDVSADLGTSGLAFNINSGGTTYVNSGGTYTLNLFTHLQVDGQLSVDGKLFVNQDSPHVELGIAWLGTYVEFERGIQYGWDMELIPQTNIGYAIGGAPYTEDRSVYRKINLHVEHMSEYWTVNTLMPIMEEIVGKKDVILVIFPDSSTTSLGANTTLYGRIEDHFAFREAEAVFRCGIDLNFAESL